MRLAGWLLLLLAALTLAPSACARRKECSKGCQQECVSRGCDCVDESAGECKCKCWD